MRRMFVLAFKQFVNTDAFLQWVSFYKEAQRRDADGVLSCSRWNA